MKDIKIERRSFLKYAATATVATGLLSRPITTQAGKKDVKLRKALQIGMLPRNLSDADKFKLARECGFEGIEGSPMDDLEAAQKLGSLAREAGVPIHSIVYGGWGAPFSDPDPRVIEKGLAGMETALRSAKALGAETVLLVPAMHNLIFPELNGIGFSQFLQHIVLAHAKPEVTDSGARYDGFVSKVLS